VRVCSGTWRHRLDIALTSVWAGVMTGGVFVDGCLKQAWCCVGGMAFPLVLPGALCCRERGMPRSAGGRICSRVFRACLCLGDFGVQRDNYYTLYCVSFLNHPSTLYPISAYAGLKRKEFER